MSVLMPFDGHFVDPATVVGVTRHPRGQCGLSPYITLTCSDGGAMQAPWSMETDAQALAIVDAHNACADTPNPWRPGAHDEERVAVGGERQLYSQGQRPPDNRLPPERVCAPGAAGRWLAVGMVPETDYSGDYPVTYTTTVWARWLVPVQS